MSVNDFFQPIFSPIHSLVEIISKIQLFICEYVWYLLNFVAFKTCTLDIDEPIIIYCYLLISLSETSLICHKLLVSDGSSARILECLLNAVIFRFFGSKIIWLLYFSAYFIIQFYYGRSSYQIQPKWKVQPEVHRLAKLVGSHCRCGIRRGKSPREISDLWHESSIVPSADALRFCFISLLAINPREVDVGIGVRSGQN